MKILFLVIDGLGDRPIPQFKSKTPLEAARTPNLDYLAEKGVCGLMEPFSTTAIPTSEESHFSLFGYNPKDLNIRRGIFTAKGAGMKLKKGDVALRGNFGTVDRKLNMIDRRAGRIKDTRALISSLDGMVINNVKFFLRSAGEHRVAIVMRGRNLSSKILDGDPHYYSLGKKVKKIVPLDKSSKSTFTARVLNEFLKESHKILKEHPLNKKRKKKGLPVANYILTRGASSLQKVLSFKKKYNLKACCVAGKILYQQIALFLRMKLIKVKGANGLVSTNLKGKIRASMKALKKYDFVFLHIKATDSLAEDGNFLGKRKFIKKIDKSIKPLLRLKNTLIVVTADHSTCCSLKRHCKELIPFLIYGKGEDSVSKFSEKDCKKGELGLIKQTDLMGNILKLKGH